MIETYEGRLGGGKTYSAVQRIIDYLAHGGVVATNINLQLDPWHDPAYGEQAGLREVLRRRGWELQPGQVIILADDEFEPFTGSAGKTIHLSKIQMFWKHVPRGTPKKPSLVVIDEAHFHFPQSGYRNLPQEVVNFLTLSRHACTDIIFISQHIKNMWTQMSRLAQYRWQFRDMKKFGVPFSLGFMTFTIPWFFPHVLQLQYDYDGKTLIRRNWDWRNIDVHACYRSPKLIRQFETDIEADDFAGKGLIKKGLTMKEKISYLLSGVLLSSLIWGLVRHHNPRIVEVPSVVTNIVERVVSPVSPPPNPPFPVPGKTDPDPDPEYFTGSVLCGDRSRLMTTKAVYRLGDILDDGRKVVAVRDGRQIVLSSSAGIEVKKFPTAPKEEKNPHRL